jgi:S1-C subfamily serine protease
LKAAAVEWFCGLPAPQGTARDDYGRLVLGDVIVGLNGRPVKSEKDFFDILDSCKVLHDALVTPR